MSDRNRNNNWSSMLGLAVGAAVAAGAGYLAYKAAEQLNPQQHEREQPLGLPRPQLEQASYDLGVPNSSNAGPRSNRRTSSSARDVLEKHRDAAPYYFFLSSVIGSKDTHSEPLTLRFDEILDPSLGDLESSLQMNCVVEYNWLMAQYHIANQSFKPITILYQHMDIRENEDDEFVTAVKVKTPFSNGSHHTKMCVLAYKDGSVRVCVHTANLVECEWDNCVQGVWLSPLCPALPLDAHSNAGESQTNFKKDLIEYLSTYNVPQLQPWIGKLRGADFSNINVFFVASIPGSHNGVDSDKWGLAKLARLLEQHVQIKAKYPPSSWEIIAQSSNIGGLGGPVSTSSFYGQVKHALSRGLCLALHSPPPISLVFPSFENVAASYDGLHGGSRLLYSRETHSKQRWLQQQLFGWKCDRRHRTKAMPHIKTYACVSPDHSELAWFHLTSCNLTQAAWGCKNNGGVTRISSYEAGVLFLPKFLIRSSSFPLEEQNPGYLPIFPMPYDLPLTPYTSRDEPWFVEDHP